MGVIADSADSVLLAVASVPAGRVTSYGSIGRLVGVGPRVVARVLATRGGEVCWWRILRADGSIAPQLLAEATVRLAADGVPVSAGRVDFRRFGVELGG